MDRITLALIIACFSVSSEDADSKCSKGEKLHTPEQGSDLCAPCDPGTYMPEDNHSHTTCKSCTFIEDPDVEVFVSFCSTTDDSVILCKDGFYRRRARNDRQRDRCEVCTYCPHPTRACQGYHDTVCCHPNQDAVMTSSGEFVCEERPVVCGPGQFFITLTEECLPCPAETFMSAHNHTYKECLKCEQLSENNANHAIITRPCSRTAPTLFGCKDGYFRDPTQESSQKEVPCSPCQSCDRSLVDCDMFHDAICDVREEVIAGISSASENENKHQKPCLKISTKTHNEILDATELTPQSNKNKNELSSDAGSLKVRDVWLYVLIFVIVLLLSNLVILVILFTLRPYTLKVAYKCDKTGFHLVHIKNIHEKQLLTMTGLVVMSAFVFAVTLLTLAVSKRTDKQKLVTVSIAIILSIVGYVTIYSLCLDIIITIRKFLLDGFKNKEVQNTLLIGENKRLHNVSQEKHPMMESVTSAKPPYDVSTNIEESSLFVPENKHRSMVRQEEQVISELEKSTKPAHDVSKSILLESNLFEPDNEQLHNVCKEEKPVFELEISTQPAQDDLKTDTPKQAGLYPKTIIVT